MKKVLLDEDWAYDPVVGDEILVQSACDWNEAGALDEMYCTEVEDDDYDLLVNGDPEDREWQEVFDKYFRPGS